MFCFLQNVPTMGISALDLASLLCDEVSLAGFGYNLSQKGAPLHYYDHMPMSAMLWQKSHNVDRETELLQRLVREGAVTDLTGGIHCSFCPSWPRDVWALPPFFSVTKCCSRTKCVLYVNTETQHEDQRTYKVRKQEEKKKQVREKFVRQSEINLLYVTFITKCFLKNKGHKINKKVTGNSTTY